MKYPKRRQYEHAKSRYRVKNWGEYEAGLRSRGLEGQRVEVQIGCAILNRMARLGMPDSHKVA